MEVPSEVEMAREQVRDQEPRIRLIWTFPALMRQLCVGHLGGMNLGSVNFPMGPS